MTINIQKEQLGAAVGIIHATESEQLIQTTNMLSLNCENNCTVNACEKSGRNVADNKTNSNKIDSL